MSCTGRVVVGQDAAQPLQVAKDQRGALVGGEAPREADGQRIGIEHLVGSFDLRLAARRAGCADRAPDCAPSQPVARGGVREFATAPRQEWSALRFHTSPLAGSSRQFGPR